MKYVRCYISAAEKNQDVLTTSGTYPWSVVTKIFRYDSPSHGGGRNTFEVMTLP
jgi:hypothetical protein